MKLMFATLMVIGIARKKTKSNRVFIEWVMGIFNKYRGMYKAALRQALAERDGCHCGVCQKPFTDYRIMTIDHKIPLSKGGNNDYHNLQLAHDECNQLKADKVAE